MYEGYRLPRRKQMRRRRLWWMLQDTATVVVWIFIGYLIALGLVELFN